MAVQGSPDKVAASPFNPTRSARKRASVMIDLTNDDSEQSLPKKAKNSKGCATEGKEKRLRIYRTKASKSYLERHARALSQRMFVLDRRQRGTAEKPEESIEIAGTTGNIYTVEVKDVPSCTCPDANKGNMCKHLIYVLVQVLKAPEHLQYQRAFLSSELREMLGNAPIISAVARGDVDAHTDAESPGNRKPVEGDCPICFTEFEPEKEEIVWCKAACGNNIHGTCFQKWAESQGANGQVRCVYCRTPWSGEIGSLGKMREGATIGEDGYVNIAGSLGISGRRDTSTYHQSRGRGYRSWHY